MKYPLLSCKPPLRTRHEAMCLELTAIPTAAGREQRVQRFMDQWLNRRKASLKWKRDGDGNLLITSKKRSRNRPLLFTAHLDHPGFVVTEKIDNRTVVAEFRGGVLDPYFENARVEFFNSEDDRCIGTVKDLQSAEPFKRATIRFTKNAEDLAIGDVGRWAFPKATISGRGRKRLFKTNACDDLAAAAAALAAFDRIRKRPGMEHVGILFTVAEEVGFVGAIGAAQSGFVPKNARLICLENSRASDECPIGGGPVVRVGDRLSVFNPILTNLISECATEYAKQRPHFIWQRKLMVGGACEATAFSTFGFESTCLCLPLGNYHNMDRIDETKAGERPAPLGREFVSTDDFHGFIELLEIVAHGTTKTPKSALRELLLRLRKRNSVVFEGR